MHILHIIQNMHKMHSLYDAGSTVVGLFIKARCQGAVQFLKFMARVRVRVLCIFYILSILCKICIMCIVCVMRAAEYLRLFTRIMQPSFSQGAITVLKFFAKVRVRV